jgi:hypothetical protein
MHFQRSDKTKKDRRDAATSPTRPSVRSEAAKTLEGAHCQCRIVGRGVEANGTMYCCAHCARQRKINMIYVRVTGPDRTAWPRVNSRLVFH